MVCDAASHHLCIPYVTLELFFTMGFMNLSLQGFEAKDEREETIDRWTAGYDFLQRLDDLRIG